ncbi:uncharacterized protein LOC143018442 [Oratosquilla oratoria]|uniref:uncharacterized protein LOC143018442 n=1 Tax=Oratosquilla oratoria TaxID=337810 RepID=UPI003F75ABD2
MAPACLMILIVELLPLFFLLGRAQLNYAKYVLWMPQKRGTSLLGTSPATSKIWCTTACALFPGCKALNWHRVSATCELLSSVQTFEDDTSTDIYVPDDLLFSWTELRYSCSTCQGPSVGKSDWVLDCPRPDWALVGVATKTDWTDLDYMICVRMEGQTIEQIDGGVIANDRICGVVMNLDCIITGLYHSTIDFKSPGTLSYQCRQIIASKKVNYNNCFEAPETVAKLPGTPSATSLSQVPPNSNVRLRMCPHQTVMGEVYWPSPYTSLKLLCCSTYDP